MLLKKNDIINLTITSATAEGSGVGKTEDGLTVFVPLSAIGDTLEVRILKLKKNYAFGKIERIVEPSADRIKVDCPHFEKCGGCVWRHISYEAECKIKEQKVKDAVCRIGGIENVPFEPIMSFEKYNRYRNKAQLPIGKNSDGNAVIGFFAFHTHRIIDCGDCALQTEVFTKVMEITRKFIAQTNADIYDEKTGKGRLRHLYMRLGEITNELMVAYVVNGNGLKQEDLLIKMLKAELPNLKSVIINSNREKTNVVLGAKNRVAYGREYITDELCGLKFKISPFSFWQVNRAQAEKLYNKAKKYAELKPNDVLLDLYCGTGTIGLTMANSCKTLVGVEIVEDAIKDANENARINNIENARFICSDAEKAAQTLKNEGLSPDVVILDPPRKGCGEGLVNIISAMSPERIVYVSCDPATLARDLKYFADKNYKVNKITPCDMFPKTAHVETVCLLSKLKVNQHIEVELEMDELDLTAAESKATYEEIKEYVLEHTGLKVSHLYIAQVKRKYGIIERINYNTPKSENSRQPQCPPEKEAAIKEALEYFRMI